MEPPITEKKLILIYVASSYSLDVIKSGDKTGTIPNILVWQPPE